VRFPRAPLPVSCHEFLLERKNSKKCPEGTGLDPPHVHNEILPFFSTANTSRTERPYMKKRTPVRGKKRQSVKKEMKEKKKKKIQPGVGLVWFGGHPEPSRVVSLQWAAKHRAQERPRTP
jgi:hypothetical protein